MKLFKFIIMMSTITLISLAYVHQQVELVKLSYAIEHKEKKMKDVLDRKETLSYNIENLEAPSRLEKVLSARKVDIAYPKRGNVFRMAAAPSAARGYQVKYVGVEKKINILGFLDFFSSRAEAQAREK